LSQCEVSEVLSDPGFSGVRVRNDTRQAVHNDRDLSAVCLAVASGLPGSSS